MARRFRRRDPVTRPLRRSTISADRSFHLPVTLASLLAALLLDYWRPLDRDHPLASLFTRYADFLERQFNGGERHQAVVAWALAVLPVLVAVGVVYLLLAQLSGLLAWAWNVLVLYLTVSLQQGNRALAEIEQALRRGDDTQARERLERWRGETASDLGPGEVARLAIEQGLLEAHRGALAAVFWFVVLPGPIGAVLYRLTTLIQQRWSRADGTERAAFAGFAAQAFQVLDWLPARLTAASFAIVGDFEDAVYCWQRQASTWLDRNEGIVLASGAGALGVRLGEPYRRYGELFYRPELGIGDEADPDMVASARLMIWRVITLWGGVLVLIAVARWFG
ncbi:MAG: cobalamin biosynthesis protein CobD [Burkholderiales bacterium]|nr:MAG: cobalamin biosynthesis protein CobD [Burkholderiales bacterium]